MDTAHTHDSNTFEGHINSDIFDKNMEPVRLGVFSVGQRLN